MPIASNGIHPGLRNAAFIIALLVLDFLVTRKPHEVSLREALSWSAFVIAALLVCVLAPMLNLVVPESSPLHMSDYAVALVGKIMCYAICALAMDLIWGYTGILSLGHGLFFALGGYVMGMYLMRQIGRDGNYKSDLPDFMVFLDWKTLPWHWTFSDSFIATLILIIAVPGLVAFVFGYFAFRSRIKGVYFSIITQAMTFAAMLLFFRNETGFGGNNGFTDFKRILGLPVATQSMRMTLFVLTGLTLLGCFLFARWLVRSHFGRLHATQLCQVLANQLDVAWFVTLPSVGVRRQVWGVRLHHQPIHAQQRHKLVQAVGIAKGYGATQAEHEPPVICFLGQFKTAAEGVPHPHQGTLRQRRLV